MIKLTRVDHRLVHGQVAFAWTKFLGADCILVASDPIAKDELRMAALRMAKPSGVKLVVKSIDDSAEALNNGVTDKYNLFILTESIEDAYRLSQKAPCVDFVNLGGIKSEEDKRQISKAIFVNDADCDYLRKLDAAGVRLEIRMVPDDPAQDPLKLI